MVASLLPFETSTVRNHLFVRVPWSEAEALRDRLEKGGIPAIACFEPTDRTAGLEIMAEVDVEKVRSILSPSQQ